MSSSYAFAVPAYSSPNFNVPDITVQHSDGIVVHDIADRKGGNHEMQGAFHRTLALQAGNAGCTTLQTLLLRAQP